jgi:pimeloyl-ACP methyl ester carboxylesterase
MALKMTQNGQSHGARSSQRPVPFAMRIMRLLFSRVGGVLPGLMGRWACRLWFRTRRFPESAAGKRATGRAGRATLVVNGIPVALYSWGTGPVVVFVHGWSGRGSQAAAFVEPLAQAGYRVIAVDAPGHGETPGDRTSIFECAAVLQAIARQYGPLHAVITHSFGGMVLAYAMRHGLAVARVVCISAPADIDFLLDNFARTLSMHPAVAADLRRRLAQRYGENLHEQVSTSVNVRNLSTPALIIHDADDASVPVQQGELIAAAWPGARFLKTRGLGHGRILRATETVQAAVEFIGQ